MPTTMTFAIIATGGKQYKVAAGDVLTVEKITEAPTVGKTITFDQVLLVDTGTETKLGTPSVPNAKVEATVVEIGRARKIDVVRFKAKSRYFKLRGHRQPYCKVKIVSIS